MRVGYLTKRKDACWYVRVLTPASLLTNEYGFETKEALLELAMRCPNCKEGGIQELQYYSEVEDDWSCAHCGKRMLHDVNGWRREVDELIEWADVVVVQRFTSAEHIKLMAHIKQKGKALVGEADDDYFNVPEWNTGYSYYIPRRQFIEDGFRICDAVTVTTPALKDLYSEYNDNVQLIPNAHDVEMAELMPPAQALATFNFQGKPISWDHFVQKREGKKLFAWWGSPTHQKDLEIVAKAIKKLVDRDPNVIVGFMGYVHRCFMSMIPEDRLFLFGLVPLTSYFSAIKALDQHTLFCPVERCQFNKGKSSLKVNEAQALGIFPVASDFDTYRFGVGHGLLAENTEYEWWRNLRRAASMDESERIDLIEKNREFVKEYFDIKVTAPLWANFYKTLKCEENRYDELLRG